MKLVDDWRHGYKFASAIIGTLLAMVAAAQELLPGMKEFLSPPVFAWVVFAMSILGVGGRLVKQQIPVTQDEKVALINTIVETPIKAKEPTPVTQEEKVAILNTVVETPITPTEPKV